MSTKQVKYVTGRQRSLFFSSFQKAVSALGIVGSEAKETYRVQVMVEETGKEHLHELNRTGEFEACISRFASDACDFATAGHFASADANRIGYIIKVCCLQVMQLKGGDPSQARNYLTGILEQQRIPCGRYTVDDAYFMDVAPQSAMKTFQILDTYRRRLITRTGSHQTGFRPDIVYHIDGPILTLTGVGEDYYRNQPFVVNMQGGAK